jgi:hypothetical protein
MQFQENQMRRELLGVLGLNWAAAYTSSSRQQMIASHLSQMLVFKDSTERRFQTGMEREFGKRTFSIKMPCDAYVLRVIDYYRRAYGEDEIKESPSTLIIYENAETREVGILEIPRYCSYHQHFGFEYVLTPELLQLRKGSSIKEGTILANSPSINSQGGYQYGRETNVAFMTHPAIAEDGIVICRDQLRHFTYKQYETRIFKFGSNCFPLNLYGDETHYKPFPDIGEYIHANGPFTNILAGLRPYDDLLGLIEENIYSVRQIDTQHDQLIYGDGAGGRVIDIRVDHDPVSKPCTTPTGMVRQLDKYNNAKHSYHQEIADVYNELFRNRGENLKITPDFQQLIEDTIAVLGVSKFLGGHRVRIQDYDKRDKAKIKKEYHCEPIDDWRVTIVLEYDKVPDIGSKFTDVFGG